MNLTKRAGFSGSEPAFVRSTNDNRLELILSGFFGHATFNCVSSFNSRCGYFDDARVKSAIDNTTGERWRISIR
jgi:hypothetical protein